MKGAAAQKLPVRPTKAPEGPTEKESAARLALGSKGAVASRLSNK